MIQRWGKIDTGRVHTDGKRIEAFDADEVAALERELAETKAALAAKDTELTIVRKATELLAEKLTSYNPACVHCCVYWTAPHHYVCGKPEGGTCADGIKAWALAEARKQEEAK